MPDRMSIADIRHWLCSPDPGVISQTEVILQLLEEHGKMRDALIYGGEIEQILKETE